MELYNFTLINGSDYSVECANGMRCLMYGRTPWVVPIECGKKQGPNCKRTKENLGHWQCGHGPIVWPLNLAQEIPTFARWLLDHVRTQMANGVVVNPDVVVYFCPPSIADTYNNMRAYGNHYKVDVEIGPTHATYDNGVACIFRQGNCSFV